MPIYMDRHFTEDATHQVLSDAHEKDLNIQDKYDVQFITYWFDEARSTAFCLVNAPNKEAIQNAHNEAHGNVPHEIIEVEPSIVEAFLGRVKDPEPIEKTGQVSYDSAFRVIMFSDLKDSTKMTTKFGDTAALNLLHIHNLLTRKELKNFNGNEVKHTGDGIMASFTDVKQAIGCAIAIQKAFKEYNSQNSSDKQLLLKIGLSAGEPIEEHGDLFGQSVQLAARLCEQAQSNQILVSSEIQQHIENSEFTIEQKEPVNLKGFSEAVLIFEVVW